MQIQPATAGSEFRYAGAGVLESPSLSLPLVDQRVWGGTSTDSKVKISERDELAIAIGQEFPRLSISGDMRASRQVTYWLLTPSLQPIPIADEWLDLETGSPTQVALRAMAMTDEGTIRQTRMGRFETPGLLMAPLFWSKIWRNGETLDLSYLHDKGLPGTWQNETHHLSIVTAEVDGHCQLIATGSWKRGSTTYEIKVAFREGVALPVIFHLKPERPGTPDFSLALQRATAGDGPALVPMSLPAGFPVGLPTVPVSNGLLQGAIATFPTNFEQAAEVARNDSEGVAWFQAHPTAVPASAFHAFGDPSSNVLDSWDILWTDGAGPSWQTVVVHNKPGLLPLVAPEFDVFVDENDPISLPTWGRDRVSLDVMGRFHEELYGTPPEVLQCMAPEAYCGVGTHAATGESRFGSSASGSFVLYGLLFWPDRGLVLQDTSYVDNLGPPVPLKPT